MYPRISNKEYEYVKEVLDQDFRTSYNGSMNKRLEAAFAEKFVSAGVILGITFGTVLTVVIMVAFAIRAKKRGGERISGEETVRKSSEILLAILLFIHTCFYCSYCGPGASFKFANLLSIPVNKVMEMEFTHQKYLIILTVLLDQSKSKCTEYDRRDPCSYRSYSLMMKTKNK